VETVGEKALLVLEDGLVFRGEFFGEDSEVFGEVVFSTGMTGYQEALTDPSYRGQILTMTYPLAGNYGITSEDFESKEIQVRGLLVSSSCELPSNHRSKKTLGEFLKEYKIPGVSGIDTRALTRKLREHGTMRGKICKEGVDTEKVAEELRKTPYPDSEDLLPEVSRKKDEIYKVDGNFNVTLVDCGAKQNMVRCLLKRGVSVRVVPPTTSAEEILKGADGVIVSSGPGDPEMVPYLIDTVKNLFGEVPLFGICLGHQIIGLAAGAKTYKLKFGHRGVNHGVKDLESGKIYITTQNHGYSLDAKSIEGSGFEVSHINLNDSSVEGMRHKELPIFSVQYHPEGCPGPQDNEYLFDKFVELMNAKKK
tara:strand:- start:52136 stop:53230 length:1095 start_codon:yes stop_codon:yes gene_type:complete